MKQSTSRARVQAFGGFLTNMVLPNIGAFIAWGLATAFFIPTGWLPNEHLNELIGPTSKFLLPLLLSYSGGKMVGGHRGGVLGSIATIGAIIGSEIPMFLGAMILGPLGGWIMKKVDDFLVEKIPAGFEMVVNNFSIGIIGFVLMIISFLAIGPIVEMLNNLVVNGVEFIVNLGLLPLLSIINEPAKVLFLNNVIDQGIYYPLGVQQTAELGKSIYFMVASNPGPGLGLLLAYSLFGKGSAKRTAPGAIIIHFFGGIHEMYFPYVLMKPITILSMILGGISGIMTFQLFGAGLVNGPSPGSIFSYLILTPKGNYIGVLAGVLVATIVSFLVTSFILKVSKDSEENISVYEEQSTAMKAEGKNIGNHSLANNNLEKIAFACDAGMGSSAMTASVFKKKLKENNITGIQVANFNIENVPEDSDILVVHKDLESRARKAHPSMNIMTIDNYLKDDNLDRLLDEVKKK
ncbi:PTS mannitol transporter subunit IICB [Aerococcus sp. JJEM-2022a]|uniref:PTS system mannitol-specific EIICB component n=2 Tax=Aerococcus loyolae TaxID=2976809 RepID=A0ABT4BYB8_9LACT|nr:PTS mannitol transporter subunit IICB [Aerococcus loyolae]MCY3027047.1 PTS mannitol transporter subunit IICB [Aerococcus loyolae]MCY3028630.1 PTS mannitol transporter subunit IICB [Aerococcus loyolae]